MSQLQQASDLIDRKVASVGAVTRPTRRRNGGSRGLFYGGVLVLLIFGVAAAGISLSRSLQNHIPNYPIYTVKRGTFSIQVTERGNLESARNVEHYCEVEGRIGGGGGGGGGGGTTILWIIEEGTQVKKDDLLVELDSSNLEDMVKTQRIAYETALSSYARAKADVETAEKAIREYEDGLFVQDLKTLQAQVTVAEENRRRAQDNARYTEVLYRKGFVNKEELEAAQFAVTNAELNLDKAKTALDVLVNVTKEKMLTQLEGDLQAKSSIFAAEKTRVEQEKARLDKVLSQLERCKIYAKADGMVVYYIEEDRWGPDDEDRIQEGAVVRERQKLIILPDLSNMQVRVQVHESKIDWVHPGQPAEIRVDAFANKVLAGRVQTVATTPAPGAWFEQDKRAYPVIVGIENPVEGLKPGMTAQTTILIDRLNDVLMVPVQCVRTVGEKRYCYVFGANGRWEEREVQFGRSNDRFIQVLDGLQEGERVIESPQRFLDLPETQLAAKDSGPSPADGTPGSAATLGSASPGQTAEDSAQGSDLSAPGGVGQAPRASQRGRGQGGGFDLFANDQDNDGKVSREEAPEWMHAFFDQMDTDGDGAVDRSEAAEARRRWTERMQQQGGGFPGGDFR